MQNVNTDRAILEVDKRYALLGSRSGASVNDIPWGLGYGKYGANEVHRIRLTGAPTGGTFGLKWRPNSGVVYTVTDALAYSCTAEDVFNAFQPGTNVESGDIKVWGGPFPDKDIFIMFKGRYAVLDVDITEKTAVILTGGTSPDVSITETVKGGVAEEYLAAIQKSGDTTATLYSINPTTFAFTSIATGLHASEWQFKQYAGRVYAANAVDGLYYRTLGGAWSGPSSTIFAATSAPAASDGAGPANTSHAWTGATFPTGSMVGFGTNPTITITGTGDVELQVVLNAALTDTEVSFTVDLPADVDLSNQDAYQLKFTATPSEITVDADTLDFRIVNSDTVPITILPEQASAGSFDGGTLSYRRFHFVDSQREFRDNISKVTFNMKITKGTSTKHFKLELVKNGAWMNDRDTTVSIANGPIRKPIEYAYSFYQVSTDLEGKLSPTMTTLKTPSADKDGSWINVVGGGTNTLTTADRVRFYRKDGYGTWRRIAEVANVLAGPVSVVDKNMEHEVELLDAYGSAFLPNGAIPDVLGIFKQSLIVGADHKLWISGVGSPFYFAPDPEDDDAIAPDPGDADRPRTVFMSDTRAEDIQAIVGQDSLYGIGPASCYAMVGDTPAELTPPRKMPGTRGSIGRRAATGINNGATVAAVDGLWFYVVSRSFTGDDNGAMLGKELTQEVRASWDRFVGSDGTSAIVIEHNGETWAFNGQRYFRITRNGELLEGTFADSVAFAYSSRDRGLRFLDSKGRFLGFDSAYTTDAGANVAWNYSTGKLDGPRVKIVGIELLTQGQPRLTVEAFDGAMPVGAPKHFDVNPGKVNLIPCNIPSGYRFKLTFSGTQADSVEAAALIYEGAPGGKGN